MKKISLYILILATLLTACDSQKQNNEDIIVEIENDVLLKSEVRSTLPDDISEDDSLRLTQEYTENWIKRKLLVYKAELNIGDNKEVNQLVDDYREQLLTEHYLRLLVEHKADITPTQEQIDVFYDENKTHYTLTENILKGIFVVLPLDASNEQTLYQLLKANEIDHATIETYCLQNAAKVDFFQDQWLAYREIKKHLPEINKTEEQILKRGKFFETQDSLFNYILKIDEYKLKGEITPLPYIQEELSNFLENNNKVIYIQRLENDLYDEAIRKGLIQFNQ